jgi:hypothetical protein
MFGESPSKTLQRSSQAVQSGYASSWSLHGR